MSKKIDPSKLKCLYRDPRWARIRAEAFAKAGYKCEECGLGISRLACHHISPIREGGEWFPSLDGVKVLCMNCHAEWHKQRRDKMPEDWAKLLQIFEAMKYRPIMFEEASEAIN